MRSNVLTSTRSGAVCGGVSVPGDKSISHRALILGALASGRTQIEGLADSLDVRSTVETMRAFGAQVGRQENGTWQIAAGSWRSPQQTIDCGNSGTTVRLALGAAAGQPIEARFTGDASLRKRPMGRVIEPLRAMGATVTDTGSGRLPIGIRGRRVRGIRFENRLASAQVKSAVLLAGLGTADEVEVIEPHPSRDHTERMLEHFGSEIEYGNGYARLGRNRKLSGTLVRVPADSSSAAFPLVAAAIVPHSTATVQSVLVNPLRFGLFEALRTMNARITLRNRRRLDREEVADIELSYGPLHAIDLPAERAPAMIDEYPILAIAAAFANGVTIMRGLSELRFKECDRLAAITQGLTRCGIRAWTEGDDLFVEGCSAPPRGGATIEAFDDHRIAMSFLVLGLASEQPVAVDSAAAIATSFPGFVSCMRSLGGVIA